VEVEKRRKNLRSNYRRDLKVISWGGLNQGLGWESKGGEVQKNGKKGKRL